MVMKSVYLVLPLGVMMLVVAAVQAPAHAQSADLVLCDRVAADPADPDKPADIKGTSAIAPSDVSIAIKYCKTAASSSRRAMFELGRAYAAGQKFPEAVAAYRKAADKGSTAAMVELGLLLQNGNGVAADQQQARSLFERAAAAGDPRGATSLLALSGSGGLPSDPAEARSALQKAADANSAEAQFQLGVMYAEGTGGPKDDAAARALFEKAAAQGHAQALDWAGNFAETGRGGPKNTDAAKAYYQQAAALGNEDAKAALDRMKCPYVVKDKRGKVVSTICF
jgi:TPR repeat protein